jgi:hypothetical protein
MHSERSLTLHNTPSPEQQPKLVTVTHLNHALYGQKFEFVGLRNGKQQVVVIRLPRGNTARLPVDYTDYRLTPMISENNSSASSRNRLSVEGLLQVIKLVDAIKKRQNPCVRKKSKG